MRIFNKNLKLIFCSATTKTAERKLPLTSQYLSSHFLCFSFLSFFFRFVFFRPSKPASCDIDAIFKREAVQGRFLCNPNDTLISLEN